MTGEVKRYLLPGIAVAIILIGAFQFARPRETAVKTLTVAPAPAERILAVNGRIRPRLQVDVRASLGGILTALPFDVGSQVNQNDIIAQIDDAPERAAIEQAQAAADAQVMTLAQARRDLARYEELGEFAARRDVEQRRLAVAEGERELNRRRASVTQARELRDRRVVRAPFAGIILERPVDPGQTISPESIIYRLADLTSPEVTAEVDEIYAAQIEPGTEALVSLPEQKAAVPAEVVHIEPRVDPATGARDVRLRLREAAITAPAGLTVAVNLIIEKKPQAISIPRRAIQDSGTVSTVRIVDSGGIVREREIGFIDWPSEQVIVTSGLGGGERVLIDPNAARLGDKVKAIP